MIKAGIDFGNSKVSCVVANYKNSKDVEILSIVSSPSQYLKKNVILNYEYLLDQVKNLILESEKKSQTKLNSINLNCSLISSSSQYYDAEININNDKISELHIKKIINKSNFFNSNPNDFELFNNIISYSIDNKHYYEAPLGNYSDNIKINFYKILTHKRNIENFANIIKSLKINIEHYIPSPLSSSLSTLTNDEKELGTICIDLGHSFSSIAIFDNNKLVFADSIGIGSNNVTLDIARGVSTTISSAERLKTLYGSLHNTPSDEHEIIEIPIISGENNNFKQIKRSTLNSIIKPRIEETLEILWQKIKDNYFNNKTFKNVVITGGGSQLDNIEQYVSTIFASSSRIAKPKNEIKVPEDYYKPGFCDIIGSIMFDPSVHKIKFLEKHAKKTKNQGISGFFSWLDQYI